MDISTFLMFEGRAEEAMNFYVSVFDDAEIVSINRYDKGQGGPEGTVMNAVFKLAGREYMCIDSPAKHGFSFTPAMSYLYNAIVKNGLKNSLQNYLIAVR